MTSIDHRRKEITMAELIAGMTVSLDGFVADTEGDARRRRRAAHQPALPGGALTTTRQRPVARWQWRQTSRYASSPSGASHPSGPAAMETRSGTVPHTATSSSSHDASVSW